MLLTNYTNLFDYPIFFFEELYVRTVRQLALNENLSSYKFRKHISNYRLLSADPALLASSGCIKEKYSRYSMLGYRGTYREKKKDS